MIEQEKDIIQDNKQNKAIIGNNINIINLFI